MNTGVARGSTAFHLAGSDVHAGARFKPESFSSLRGLLFLVASVLLAAASIHYVFDIVPQGAAARGRAVVPDLYPMWYATRAVLMDHRSPYTARATRDIQRGLYGEELRPGSGKDEQRFAYPLFAVVPFGWAAFLSFRATQSIALFAYLVLGWFSIRFWLSGMEGPFSKLVLPLLVCSSIPFVLCVQLRQPTMVAFALSTAAISSLRRNRLIVSGILLALATIKPQAALAIAIPALLWALANRRERQKLIWSFGTTGVISLAVSECLLPGWFGAWLDTIRAYPHYAGAKAWAFLNLGARFSAAVPAICIVAAILVSMLWCKRDLLFAISFSLVCFQIALPLQLYNGIFLIVPVVWLAKYYRDLSEKTFLEVAAATCLAGLFVVCAGGTLLLGIYGLMTRLPLVPGWYLPLIPVYLLPSLLFVLLGAHVLATIWNEWLLGSLTSAGKTLLNLRHRLQAHTPADHTAGQSLLEAAIALPILALCLCFAVDTGYYFYVAANLTSAAKMAAEYGAQGYSSPGQLQLPPAGPLSATGSASFLAVGDIAGLQNASGSTTVAVCSKTLGMNGNLTKCSTYGSGTQQYVPDADPEAPMFSLGRVDVLYVVNPPVPLTFFTLSVIPPLTLHRTIEFRTVD